MQETLLEELNQWHSDARSSAQSTYDSIKTSVSQLQDAVSFTERLLQYDSIQIWPMRQVALRRLHTLYSTLPYLLEAMKCHSGIEFETDMSQFCAIVQAGFGHFANADNGSETTCCEVIDNSLCLTGDMYSKHDVGLMTAAKVSASADKL